MAGLSGAHPQRLGLLGGTFDPFHNGHLVAATAAMDAFSLDRVVLVPTGQPWQKSSYSPAEDRVMMTSLGAATDQRLSVSRIEVDRRGATYTIDTLESFRGFFPDTALFFIMGTDAFRALASWHRVNELGGLAEMIVVHRPPFEPVELPTEAGWPKVHMLEIEGLEVSSTEIRKRVADGREIIDLVPAAIGRLIHSRSLYREGATLETQGA